MTTLKIHSIESFGTHDGPGIRLVIFLQGCNLHCQYCHNPDTIEYGIGQERSIEELVTRAINMKSYFNNNGGVTVSGGEPLLQVKDLIPFFKRLKTEEIHTNIDTNGSVFNSDVKHILDLYADLIMVDIKHVIPENFKSLTGKNLFDSEYRIIKHREESGKKMWLRYVLVPEVTGKPEYLHKFGEHFKDYKNIERVEILPYHTMGTKKWESLGWDYELKGVPENTEEQKQEAKNILSQYFNNVKIK